MEQVKPNQQLEDLHEIRNLMERSSRFISLSGSSGIFVGLFALIGEYIAMSHFHLGLVNNFFYELKTEARPSNSDIYYFFFDALIVLVLSLGVAFFLTWRRSNKNYDSIWDNTAKRLIANLFVPLSAGGIFCLALMYQQLYALIIPSTLVFYGISLYTASKYTLNDIRFLGILDIVLGLITCFRLQYALIFWGLGFGVLHIVYGIVMYYKYER
jgi:hypothetical protein